MTYRLLIILFFLACSTELLATPGSSALVDEAWKAMETGDHQKVEQKLREAIQQDPNDVRAYLGLSLFYSMQDRSSDAWTAYSGALDRVSSVHPYLYSVWVRSQFRGGLYRGDEKALEIIEGLTEKTDSLGILKAMAHEVLGTYYTSKHDLSRAKEHYSAMNAITDWMVVGPFDNVSASGHDKVFPPEEEYQPASSYEGKNGVPAKWFNLSAIRVDNWIDFRRYFASGSAVFYANNFVYSPKKQTVHLRIGTSGSFKLFLNDELVNQHDEEYNNDLDSYIATTELQQGWNRVLVKCGFAEDDRCNFLFRITDERGGAIPDLKIGTEPQTYAKRPGAKVTRHENFAETFFKKKIEESPESLENYLLLADCYLRNDKAVDAELILRDALRKAPNNVVILDRALEAYARGEKGDEIEKTLDKIYTIDKNVPSALDYKFDHYMEVEEYDQAEAILNQFEKLLPSSPQVYNYKIRVYSKKQLFDKVIEANDEAFKRYPDHEQFVMAQAYLVSNMTKSPDAAIEIVEDFLKLDYDESTLSTLADMYLSKSDVKGWRRVYDELLVLDPAWPGYYRDIISTYISMQDYESATATIRKALELTPGSSFLWGKLAEVRRTQHDDQGAIEAYRQALLYSPTDYESRSALRELEGRKSVFEQFATVNVDSLIKNAPKADAYPEEKGVIMLDNAKRVVYERGASESSQELVVKVFNSGGIDDWKEYYIPHNSFSEELIVDKAVVVKEDGSEVKADISGNEVIFKTLESNDIIHMKWRLKNHYSGKLSQHFWDTYYFNTAYPTQSVRYSVIVPKDFKFQYKAQNMTTQPVKTDVEEGLRYTWTVNDLPAISFEYGMPTLDDIGQVLHISSIPNWQYLVDWYTDLTKAKVRSTFEIKEQVKALVDAKAPKTDEEKMKMVYDFITENIRYSSVAFRQSAYTPQRARDVLVNKIGDCKDVATLCIAMLNETGVKANYVLVNTRDAGLNANILPSIAFNHCIVAVDTKNGTKYMDLTADNYPIGSLPNSDRDAFSLVIKPGITAPGNLQQSNGLPRNMTVRSSVEIRDDNVMIASQRSTVTGSISAAYRAALRNEAKKEQEKMVLANLSSDFPNVKLVSLDFENLDNLEPQVNYVYKYEVPNYINDAGSFKFMKIPWAHGAEADEALSYEKRAYPYAYWPSEDTLTEEIEITVPANHVPVDLPATVQYKSPVAEYSLKYSFTNGKLMARRQYINKKELVAPEEYAEFKSFYNNVVKEDSRQILLKKKGAK